MADKDNMKEDGKKDRTHLRLVGKDEPLEEALNNGGMDIETIGELYSNTSLEMTNMFIDEWDDYITDGMKRDEFIRTVIEIDESEMVHPLVVFDTTAAAAKAGDPKETPKNYRILDLTKISAEEEDLLLWGFGTRGADYRVTFIPKRAVKELEQMLHDLVKAIVRETSKQADQTKDIDPVFMIGYVRGITILFNNLYNEFSVFDEDYFDDFDEDYFDGFDEDDDEDDGDDNDNFDLGGVETWPPEVRQDFEEEVTEELGSLKFNRILIGKYMIVLHE